MISFVAVLLMCSICSVTAQGASWRRHRGDGGPATKAAVNDPTAIAIDGSKFLYIVESFSVIRRVDLKTGVIATVSTKRPLVGVSSLAVESDGRLIASETWRDRICRIDPVTGSVEVIAGGKRGFAGDGGPALYAELNFPESVITDAANNIYIADTFNFRIRRVDGKTGIITSIARVDVSSTIAMDRLENLFVSASLDNQGNSALRRVAANTGDVTTITKTSNSGDSRVLSADSQKARGCLSFDRLGNPYAVNRADDRFRRLTASVQIDPSGDALIRSSKLASVCGAWVTFDGDGNLYIAHFGEHRVQRIDSQTGLVRTIAGNGFPHHVQHVE